MSIYEARDQVQAARIRLQAAAVGDSQTAGDLRAARSPEGYTFVRELRRGGQGVVYLAVQQSTDRLVAIKVLHGDPRGVPGATELARFQREVEVLSRLRHPNIVTIHDCGREGDQVYFVMDYVHGRPLDSWAQSRRISLRDMLSLFAKVCDAVNAAHLRGVIHRDLKPGNILVDEHDEPRLLDFGLAKLSDDSHSPRLQDMTHAGQFVGSLPWASPEQAEGRIDQLDLRTDVYSLGVVIYHSLTKQFPYPLSGRVDETIRSIARSEPMRPSLLRREINRELDTILLKCLAKEPERRYQTAGDLGRDVRRFLADEPIEARRDSLVYVVSKRLARYRAAAIGAASMLIVVIAALGVSLQFWRTADEQRRAAQQAAERADEESAKARRQTEIAQATVALLTNDLLPGADTGRQGGRADVTVREMLDQAAVRLDSEESLQFVPVDTRRVVHSAVRGAMARTYRALGLYDEAFLQAGAGVEAARGCQPPQPAALADALYELGEIHRARQESDLARAALAEALALAEQAYGERSLRAADVTNALAGVEHFSGRYAEAEKLIRRSLEIQRNILGEHHQQVAMLMGNLGQCLARLGRIDEAAEMVKQAAAVHRELLGEDDHQYVRDLFILGNIYCNGGDVSAAEGYFRISLEKLQKLYPSEHPLIAMCRRNLGFVLLSLDQAPEAEELFRAALAEEYKAAGQSGALITNSLSGLGRALLATGKLEEAERVLTDLEGILRANYATPGDLWRAAEVLGLKGEAIVRLAREAFTAVDEGGLSAETRRRLLEAERLLIESFETINSAPPGRDRFMTDKFSRRCEACRRLVALYDVWENLESVTPSDDGERIRSELERWSMEYEQLRQADVDAPFSTS